MIYQTAKLLRDVRVAIDQNNTSEPLIAVGDIDTLTLDEIIFSKIEEAVRRVHSDAPVHLLEEGHNFGDSIFWEDGCHGHILLPDDFMRLIAFRMSDWERTVYAAITTDNPQYAKQSSRYKGIRGNVQKPVCALVSRPEGKALEFYSCNSDKAEVVCASYLPYPHIDREGGIDICKRCYPAIVYMIAGLTACACGDSDKSAMFTELAKSILEQ